MVEIREVILQLLENKRRKEVLTKLSEGKIPFTQLKKKTNIKSNTTLSRDLEYLNSVGLIVNVFERTEEGSYSYYELNHFGRRVAQIVTEIEQEVDKKISEVIPV